MHYATIDLPIETKEEIDKVCKDIFEKDDTFKHLFADRDEDEYRLKVESKDKDHAWRRIAWLTNKNELIAKYHIRYGVEFKKE